MLSLSGLFVLILSDTELWPFGPKNRRIAVLGNLEVLQHKPSRPFSRHLA
jgi:hypothetical protein